MLRLIEVAVLAVLVLYTAVLLVIGGTRIVLVFGIRMLFIAAVVAGVVSYALGEIGVL